MNRIEDVDGLIDQIDETLLNAKLAGMGVGTMDEQALLALSLDAIDTAERIREVAIAEGDAAGAIASVDRKPVSLTASRFRDDLARQLRDGFDVDTEGSELLRSVGSALAELVQVRRDARVKARKAAEMDELNRNLLRRLKEENEPSLEERFLAMQRQQMMGEGSIEDRIAQRADLARREAIAHGLDLAE